LRADAQHTGIVNYFHKADPLLAVGSIVEHPPGRYVWRCHVEDESVGVTPDRGSAEAELRRAISPRRQRRSRSKS
jgi:hypothetical protein